MFLNIAYYLLSRTPAFKSILHLILMKAFALIIAFYLKTLVNIFFVNLNSDLYYRNIQHSLSL